MNGGGILKLQQISLKNYRGIRDLSLPLSGKSVVLYGVNGVGKSSVLRGITKLFSEIITKVSDGQIKQQVKFEKEDVKFGTSELQISGQFQFKNDMEIPYGFSFKKSNGIKRSKREADILLLTLFFESYMGEDPTLPIFSYYGVNRSVLDIPVRIKTKHNFGPMSAYQNSIGKTDFRTFFEWFRNQEDIENQEKVHRQDLTYIDPALDAVRNAITSMMPGISEVRIVRNPLRMCATKNGETLSIEQLSDGEKCTLAMFGDIARRLSIANPGVENPLLGGGIVLIDEVDLHLHPMWQREIIPALHKTFPNIQFIITTHSPLVLSRLDSDFKIFELLYDKDIVFREMVPAYYDVNMVLEDEMGTPSIDSTVTELEQSISRNIMSGDLDAANKGIKELDRITNGSAASITKYQILMYRKDKGV